MAQPSNTQNQKWDLDKDLQRLTEELGKCSDPELRRQIYADIHTIERIKSEKTNRIMTIVKGAGTLLLVGAMGLIANSTDRSDDIPRHDCISNVFNAFKNFLIR